ncbi:MAG: hypothetical protein WKG32_20590 [Gemmatimonadaceae bacterium]
MVALAVGGCRRSREAAEPAHPNQPAKVSEPRVQGAEARLAVFLGEALQTNKRYGFDSLMACIPDGQTDRYLALARYRVLGSTLAGDTATAWAEVLTVAEETEDPDIAGRYLAIARTRTDTLRWRMVRDSVSGQWGVCGYSVEGYGFGHYGTDENTGWVPAGGSWGQVRQRADSLRRLP